MPLGGILTGVLSMRIFKNKAFNQWAQKLGISDAILNEIVNDLEKGLYESNLGGHVYKKRVATGGRGKSAGARTIIAFKLRNKAFFIYGFNKNEKDNISEKEKDVLKILAKQYFSYDDKQMRHAINNSELKEVKS